MTVTLPDWALLTVVMVTALVVSLFLWFFFFNPLIDRLEARSLDRLRRKHGLSVEEWQRITERRP